MELSGGTFRGEIHDVVANDTHGVALVTFHGERDGQTVALRSADIWHLASGIWHQTGNVTIARSPPSGRFFSTTSPP